MNTDVQKYTEKKHLFFLKKRTVGEWIKYLKYYGVKNILRKLMLSCNSINTKKRLSRKKLFTKKELREQRKYVFKRPVKFSVIVPVYDTNGKHLSEMIWSVCNQTYQNWELILIDYNESECESVEKIYIFFANKYPNVKYEKINGTLSRTGNINKFIDMSSGDYIAVLGQNDILHPAALFEVMTAIDNNSADFIYSDEATFSVKTSKISDFYYKPAYSPDTLISNNYISQLSAFSRELYKLAGKFGDGYDGAEGYEFILRATSKANKVMHIPEVLYYRRDTEKSCISTEGMTNPGVKAVSDFLKSKNIDCEVSCIEPYTSKYRVKYNQNRHPRVAIIIPNYEHVDTLRKCIDSIIAKTTYDNYEIVIIENNSRTTEIFDYYNLLEKSYSNLKVVIYEDEFNYSKVNNFGAKNTDSEVLLLLNNDIEVITPDWIQEMLMFAVRDDVGAVGAKLYYPDMTIQHAGIVIGIEGLAGHSFCRMSGKAEGYMERLRYAQNVTAVTGACLMIRRDAWELVSGLNEDFKVAYNDIDLCLKLQKKGKLVVWTPFAELFHNESLSRGMDLSKNNIERFNSEKQLFKNIWRTEISNGDRYYNPNLRNDNARYLLNVKIKQHKVR